jgi:Ni/Co efflux regulator RcnB
MRTFIVAALAATALSPVAAGAQGMGEVRHDQREVRHDRREVQHDRQEVRQDMRRGDHREAQQDRRDLHQDQRDLRGDRRDRNEDWRDFREHHRDAFRAGRYMGPQGFVYRPVVIGFRFDPIFYSSRYWINNPFNYRLPPAGYGMRWIRYGNDAILINMRTGRVVQVYRDFFW